METLDERNIKNKSIVRLSHVVLGCGEMVQFPADKVRELCQGQYQNIVKLHGHVKSQGLLPAKFGFCPHDWLAWLALLCH